MAEILGMNRHHHGGRAYVADSVRDLKTEVGDKLELGLGGEGNSGAEDVQEENKMHTVQQEGEKQNNEEKQKFGFRNRRLLVRSSIWDTTIVSGHCNALWCKCSFFVFACYTNALMNALVDTSLNSVHG